MNIFISGADRGLGFGMTKKLLEMGHRVIAGQYMSDWQDLNALQSLYYDQLDVIPLDVGCSESVRASAECVNQLTDCLDLIISNAGIISNESMKAPLETDTNLMIQMYNVNAVGSVRLVESLYRFMDGSSRKRICFVSSEAGSIAQAERVDTFGYCMSKAAMNMYAKLIHNRLSKEGFQIRLYHPGWIRSYMQGELSKEGELSIDEASDLAVNYFLDDGLDDSILHLHGYDGELLLF